MIDSLVIGTKTDAEHYFELISSLKYFGPATIVVTDTAMPNDLASKIKSFDAIVLVSPIDNPYLIFETVIKAQKNFYFVDQPAFTENELLLLDKMYLESGNLMFTETVELNHPLLEEFLETTNSYLLFRYTKSIANKRQIRQALFSALCFLSVLSPMQVKKIDFNTLDTNTNQNSQLKIRLKMFDSSLCYIILNLENKNEHQIYIESDIGSFSFNFADNFLENIHGFRFKGAEVTNDSLLQRSLELFALNIILNLKPKFSFHNYSLIINTLHHIEVILNNSL